MDELLQQYLTMQSHIDEINEALKSWRTEQKKLLERIKQEFQYEPEKGIDTQTDYFSVKIQCYESIVPDPNLPAKQLCEELNKVVGDYKQIVSFEPKVSKTAWNNLSEVQKTSLAQVLQKELGTEKVTIKRL